MNTGNVAPVVDPSARQSYVARYAWEVSACARDIMDKIEMGVLTAERVPDYLSNLLCAHPRVLDEDRAAETVWVSPQRPVTGDLPAKLAQPPVAATSGMLRVYAFACMAHDVVRELEQCGLQWK